jgi:transglutaminase-like putative cysteine protease
VYLSEKRNLRNWYSSIRMKKAILSILFFVASICIPKSILATEEFTIKYDALYDISAKGETRVTQDIKISNKTSEYYVSEYSLNLSSEKVREITARDKNGPAKLDIKKEASTTAINAKFNENVTGKGNTQTLKLNYIDDSITEKNGNIWTISLPRINGTYIDEYNTTISLPKTFGTPSVVYPKPIKSSENQTSQLYYFNTKQVTDSGVTMSFGNEQFFDLGLTYHLHNTQSVPVNTEIALPPDTGYQKIILDSITPKPTSVRIDPDGNHMATYTLTGKQDLDVVVKGKANLYLEKQKKVGKLTQSQRSLYTRPRTYWESDDEKIASLAASLKTPENIYKYVVQTLSYNTDKLNSDDFFRIGAKQILNEPSNSVCMEFTDLFIALMRAAGYPARELNGYAYSRDTTSRPLSLSQDLLHAWPEYYDEEKGWVQVDPTWENTTKGVDYFNAFDLNHIVFVVKGSSSEYPYPAGSYKKTNSQTKDVLVSFSDKATKATDNYEITISGPTEGVSGLAINPEINITNTGNNTVDSSAVITISFNGKTRTQTEVLNIPPYGQKTITAEALQTEFSEQGDYLIDVTVNEFKQTKNIKMHPFYTFPLFLMGLVYLFGIPLLAGIAYFILHKKAKI